MEAAKKNGARRLIKAFREEKDILKNYTKDLVIRPMSVALEGHYKIID
jgi:hypothetical protein